MSAEGVHGVLPNAIYGGYLVREKTCLENFTAQELVGLVEKCANPVGFRGFVSLLLHFR